MKYAVGEQIGEYRITGHLGSGATGDVFRVEHSITRRVEAVKVFHASTMDEQRAQRIMRESMLQATLDHPNITAVHTALWSDGDLLLVMEYVDGQSLRQLLEAGHIPIADAAGYAGQILQALSHAHQNGVMHRDISPANILITQKGRIKLTDFGLAKKPGDRRITQSGTMMGSVHYTAPEQIRSSSEVDFRADLYSTGAVLYELFTGRKPFDADSPFDLMLAHAESKPVPPSHWVPALSPHVEAAVLRALEKDPQHRFSSAVEFLEALEGPKAKQAIQRPFHVWAGAAFLAIAAIFTVIGFNSKPVGVAALPATTPPLFVEPSPLEASIPPALEPPQPVPEPLPIPERVVTREHAAAKPKPAPAPILMAAPMAVRITGAEPPEPNPQQPPENVLPQAEAATQAVQTMAAKPKPIVIPVTPEEPKTVEAPQKTGKGFWPSIRQRINIFRRR